MEGGGATVVWEKGGLLELLISTARVEVSHWTKLPLDMAEVKLSSTEIENEICLLHESIQQPRPRTAGAEAAVGGHK